MEREAMVAKSALIRTAAEPYIDKAHGFLEETLRGRHPTAICTHEDGDGITSAVMLSTSLVERGIPHHLEFMGAGHGIYARLVELFKRERPERLIITDLGLDTRTIRFLTQQSIPTLIVDHHEYMQGLSSLGSPLTYVNATFNLNEGPAVCGVVHELCRRTGVESEIDWLPILGSATDKLLLPTLGFVRMSEAKKDAYAGGQQMDPFFSPNQYGLNICYIRPDLSRVLARYLIKSVEENNPSWTWLTQMDGDSELPPEVLRRYQEKYLIDSYRRDIERETRYWISHGQETRHKEGVFEKWIECEWDIKRMITGYYGLMHPEDILIVFRRTAEGISVSLRVHGRGSLSENRILLFEGLHEGIDYASRGIHSGSCGISNMPDQGASRLLENVIKYSDIIRAA